VRAIDLALDRKIKQEARKLAQAEQAAVLASAKGDKGEPGPQGPKGDKGEKGDKPRHQWNGTLLRFEQADGGWGKFVDLQGPKGARDPRGTGGGSAAGGGTTPTGTGGVIDGGLRTDTGATIDGGERV